MVDAIRAHSLLRHLDSLKPLLQLDFNYVKLVYERLTKTKPDHILLTYYDVEVVHVAKIFPNQSTILTPLVELFQFHKPNVGKSVIVLDLLTTMSILTTGSVTEKCKLLFTMYNINETGMMDETEHINFILRCSDCMKKLKLMGTLDMTAPEARYVTLEARVKYESNRMTFLPVLYVADFTRWVQTSKECQTLFKFVKVLNRLVDSMVALEARSSAVQQIMREKESYKESSCPVPALDVFTSCVLSPAPTWLVYRSHDTVSLTLPLHDMEITEVYVKFDKIVPLASELYEIPRAILKRNAEVYRANHRNPLLHCCDKSYLLTSYTRLPVDPSRRRRHQIPYQRVDLTGLDPGSSYYITVYTSHVKFRTVQATTLDTPGTRAATEASSRKSTLLGEGQFESSAEAKGDVENESQEDEEGGDSEDGSLGAGRAKSSSQKHKHADGHHPLEEKTRVLTILPACLSVKEAEAVCASHCAAVSVERNCVVFTGTVCEADQVLKDALQLLHELEPTEEFGLRAASAVSAAASSQYALRWQACVDVLLGMKQCKAPSTHLHELVAASEKAQTICFDGAGPWGNEEARSYLEHAFGHRCFATIQEKIENTYSLYSKSLAPPTHSLWDGATRLFLLRPKLGQSDPGEASVISILELTELLMGELRRAHDKSHDTPQHVVVLVRSPEDLLERADPAAERSSATTGSNVAAAGLPVASAASRSQLLRKPAQESKRLAAPAPKLTGRHEILHGEYSSQQPSLVAPAEDSSFLGLFPDENFAEEEPSGPSELYDSTLSMFLRVATKWLQAGQRREGDFDLDWNETKACTRKMTIVSCNWQSGENFRLQCANAAGGEVSIAHETLLQTMSYFPPPPLPDTAEAISAPTPGTLSGWATPLGTLPKTFSMPSMNTLVLEEIKPGEEGKRTLSRVASRAAKSSGSLLLEAVAETGSRPMSRASRMSRPSSDMDVTALASEPPSAPPKPAFESSAAFQTTVAAAGNLMSRLKASLPKSMELHLTDSSPARAFHCPSSVPGDDSSLSYSFSEVQVPPKEESWWRRAFENNANPPKETVEIACGPHVARCAGTSCEVSVSVVGRGRVFCTMYEVPVHMQYVDILGVVATEDRLKLRSVGSKSRYAAGSGDAQFVFHFESLTPFCCYCAVIDPYSKTPAVALFRTLGLPSSTVSSVLVCPISAEDLRGPSVRLGRLANFAGICRSPASAVYCLDYDSAVQRNFVGEEQHHKVDLNYLRKQGFVQYAEHTGGNDAHNMHSALPFLVNNASAESAQDEGSVFVSSHGHFCYISTRNEGATTLRRVIQAVRALRHEPDVHFLVLLVNQPLIRFLRLRNDGQFACDGPMNHHKLLCCLLMMSLLDWKAQNDGNDCKIICTAPVSTPKLVLIRYAQHAGDANNPYERHDDVSVATHRDAPAAAPATAAAFLQEGGDFLEMPSFLEPSLEEPSMYDSIALQSLLQERRDALGEKSQETPDVLHLDSIYESIGDHNINDLQLQNQLSAVLTASHDSKLVDRTVYRRDVLAGKMNFLTIEHLILPVNYNTIEGEEVDEHITLPDGKCLMEDIVEYEVLHEFSAPETGVYRIAPRLDLYKESLRADERVQPVVYRLEFLLHKLKPREETGATAATGAAVQDASLLENSVQSSVISFNMQHRVYLRPLLSEFDLVELLLGPVIGSVTMSTAVMLFEFNMSLRQLTCVLQPLGAKDDNDYVNKVLDGVRGFELIELQFSELLPGTIYEIYLPDLFGTKSIGKFKTIQPFVAFAQVAVTSSNTLSRHPITALIVDQLQHQQAPNLAEVRLLNDFILEDQLLQKNVPTNRVVSSGGYDNTWAKLGNHLNTPGVHTAAVFHLGDVTFLSYFWKDLVRALIAQVRRLEIPLRDASSVGQWYFKQVEQVVKDTFRLFWSTPVVKEVFSHAANVPMYHSQYLLPLSALDDQVEAARIAGSEEDNLLLQLVRRIFESHLHMYLSRLYGWDVNSSSHYVSWRSNSLAAIGMDIVSGRRKVRRKGEDDGDNEEGEGAEASSAKVTAAVAKPSKSKASKAEKGDTKKVDMKDPYSLGFLDRGQWKNIRTLVLDRTLTHLVIFTERPIIPLTALPTDFPAPESVGKGEILDWRPTQQDLEIFLRFWFDWLAAYQRGEVASCRSVLLVSTCRMPYSTLVQDIKTGLKIQQFCVGEYDRGGSLADIPFRPKELSMSGKLGTIRFVHQFDGQDYALAQSTGVERNSNFIERGAENVASPTAASASGSHLVLAKSAGFATLRLWFDSWKALGIWAQDSPESDPGSIKASNATLLVGPMLGAPILHTAPATESSPAKKHFTVAMLIEVDRPTSVVLLASSVFTDHTLRIEMNALVPRRPYVLEIGPLQPEDRYNVRLASGLKPSPHNIFVIDTYVHENETNILALNCAPVDGEVAGAQLLIDAAKRCSVPFCGMTAVLHTNFQPSFDRVIDEFRYSNSLLESLIEARRTGLLSPTFRLELENIIEVFRDQYRTVLSKPSYAELLRNGFNLMMQNQYQGFEDDPDEDPSSDLFQISQLVKLIVGRLNQEYFERWMTPHLKVFRAARAVDPKAPVPQAITTFNPDTGEMTVTEPPAERAVMEWSDAEAPAVDAIFQHWLNNCTPAPHRWNAWVSPNGKVSIEQIVSVTEDSYSAIAEQLSKSPIEFGTRIIVVNQAASHQDGADPLYLGETDIGVRFQSLLQEWKKKRDDSEVCIICPSKKYGTRKIDVKLTPIEPPPPPPEPKPPTEPLPDGTMAEVEAPPPPDVFQIVFKEVYMLDTIHRSNEFQRMQKHSEMDKDLMESQSKGKKKVAAAAAKSKRAQKQREEEERLRKEEVEREIAEVKANQIPDGYIIIGCTTTAIQTPDFTATVTNIPRVCVIGDFVGTEQEREEMHDDVIDGIPTEYDFVQLPEWFRKFSPSFEAIFVRDEVLLLMRQNPESKKVLNVIEDGDFIPQLMAMYESSRLSELSRPEDLREVDMRIPGVVSMFFRDLVKKMWDLAVPAEVKPHMFSLSDEFIMSYCFARALPDPTALTSSLSFAQAVQASLIHSLSLKSAQVMSKLDRYAYVIKSPDFPTQKVKVMEEKEKLIVDEKFAAENRKVAADKAWRLADAKAADLRDQQAKEAAEEAAAMEAALLAISKKEVVNAAAVAAAKELSDMAKDVEKTLAVVEVNYDSDLEAIANDEAEDEKRRLAAVRVEALKQKDLDHTAQSVKAFTSQRAERVNAEKTSKEKAQEAEEEAAREAAGGEFDMENEGIEKLDKLRSEWLVASMEVLLEVTVEKEIYDAVKAASNQLLEECFLEAQQLRMSVSESGRLEHAKLQVSRLRGETAKSRRVYGKRMSFMT